MRNFLFVLLARLLEAIAVRNYFEHESVCYSFLKPVWVYTNIQTISVVHPVACLANFSEWISLFCSPPTFMTTSSRNACRRHDEELIINSRKYRMFIIIPSNHQNMSRNTIWLVNNTEFSLRHKTRLPCSFAKPFPWSSTNRPKFLKRNLVSDLFHGYKDLAGQSSWWGILFCVYVYIHWS